jgi:hypothetical protein
LNLAGEFRPLQVDGPLAEREGSSGFSRRSPSRQILDDFAFQISGSVHSVARISSLVTGHVLEVWI